MMTVQKIKSINVLNQCLFIYRRGLPPISSMKISYYIRPLWSFFWKEERHLTWPQLSPRNGSNLSLQIWVAYTFSCILTIKSTIQGQSYDRNVLGKPTNSWENYESAGYLWMMNCIWFSIIPKDVQKLSCIYKVQDCLYKICSGSKTFIFTNVWNKLASINWFLIHLLLKHGLKELHILLMDYPCPLISETCFHTPEKHADI